jgi:hypothetical protein
VGRVYTVPFENVAVAGAQDLVAVKCGAGKMLKIRRVWCGPTDTALQTAQGLRFRCRFATATITLGSGGATPTPTPHDNGDSAASFTTHTNDTTQSTTSGAFSQVWANGAHNFGGVDWTFDVPPLAGAGEGFTFEQLSTPTGTCHFSGGMEVEEIGG